MKSSLSRRVLVVLLGACAAAPVLLPATDSQADGPMPGGAPLQTQPKVHVGWFHLGSQTSSTAYTGGPVSVVVDVANDTHGEQTNVVVKLDDQSQTISIPGGGHKAVTFTDTVGLTTACHPKPYRVSVTSSVGQQTETGQITPTCKIISSLVDPWNLIEPDRVVDSEKDAVYVTNAKLDSATCAGGLEIKAPIYNHTTTSAPSMIVQAKDASGRVWSQTAAAFPLDANGYKVVELTPVGRVDIPDRADITIIDWQKKFGSKLRNQGISVKTTKTCSLSAGIQPPLAMATATGPAH